MKTQIKQWGETIVVTIDGKLDFGTHIPFKEQLGKLIKKTDSSSKHLIFNLGGLEFVGSSGISAFIQTLKDFNSISPIKPKYCNVRSEFRRIIEAFDDAAIFEFFENEESAKSSYSH